MWVDLDDFVAKRTAIDFLVLFLILETIMRFNSRVLRTINRLTVFASDGKPVLLPAGVDRAVLSDILVEHNEETQKIVKNIQKEIQADPF